METIRIQGEDADFGALISTSNDGVSIQLDHEGYFIDDVRWTASEVQELITALQTALAETEEN